MNGIRSVRRKLRKKLLDAVARGESDNRTLGVIAETHFMGKCSFDVILGTFYRSEINKALALLRSEGLVMSAGRDWKLVEQLTDDDVESIAVRTRKRVNGELKSLEALCHSHGLIEGAVIAASARRELSASMDKMHVDEETANVVNPAG